MTVHWEDIRSSESGILPVITLMCSMMRHLKVCWDSSSTILLYRHLTSSWSCYSKFWYLQNCMRKLIKQNRFEMLSNRTDLKSGCPQKLSTADTEDNSKQLTWERLAFPPESCGKHVLLFFWLANLKLELNLGQHQFYSIFYYFRKQMYWVSIEKFLISRKTKSLNQANLLPSNRESLSLTLCFGYSLAATQASFQMTLSGYLLISKKKLTPL